MANPIAPPPKKKMGKLVDEIVASVPPAPLFHPPSSPSFSSLPDEIVTSSLARISKSDYRSLCSVSKSFYSLLSSPEIYAARSQIGNTELRFYICLWLPTPNKQRRTTRNNHHWFTLMMNPSEGELSLVPVRLSSSYAPARLFSTYVAVGSEIYQIGGTVNYKRSKAVRVLDCRSHTWRRSPSLTVAREGAKSCFLNGKIYVLGGEEEESMIWGEVFDIKTQTWNPLPSPNDDGFDSNHKVLVFGGKLYVITMANNYAYDPKQARWLPEVGFVDLQPKLTGPYCVIENLMIADNCGKYLCYNSRYGNWSTVWGLGSVYVKRNTNYQTIQLANYGGKLVIIWHEWNKILDGLRLICTQDKLIWCAVISLEERLGVLGTEIWGEVERCNVLRTVSKLYLLLSCLSVSL